LILNNKKGYPFRTFFAAFLACLALLFTVSKDFCGGHSNAYAQDSKPEFDLRVDSQNHARAFCYGIKAVLKICDFLEFYERNITGSRKRIFSGPWPGSMKQNAGDTYTLAGKDPASGVSYIIVFKKAGSNVIELSMTVKAPSRPSNFDFNILKLSSDIFKGASVETSPSAINDADKVPFQPLPLGRHILFTGKNRVLFKAALCDLEIKDMTESNTILAADFRNIPWEKTKSIYLGTQKQNFMPGKSYSFKYSIICLSPSQSMAEDKVNVSEGGVSAVSPWSFFFIPPKEEIKGTGHFKVRQHESIYGMPSGTAENTLSREIEKLTSVRLAVRNSEQAAGNGGIFIDRMPEDSPSGLPSEGFEVITSPQKMVIRGLSDKACLYAVYSVMSRLKCNTNDWEMECGTIRDWPDLSARGVCIELLKPLILDLSLMKRYLEAFSKARTNVVIFLHTPTQMRAWQRDKSDGWTKKQMIEVAQYARSLHMEVWGGMISKFEASDFPELDISKGTKIYNPLKDSSYDYLFSLYEELLKIYHPSTLLIAHDEITGMSIYASESSKTAADILAMDVRRIHDWLGKQGVKTAMWGDMLLDYDVWQMKVGSANSQNPLFNSGPTHLALGKIPSDVIILDWHYGLKESYTSIDYFVRNNFSVYGCPWYDPRAALPFAKSVKEYSGNGIITTDWGFWRTLSPAATTLYSSLFGWRMDWPKQVDDSDIPALAYEMRETIYQDTFATEGQYPLPIGSSYNSITYDDVPNDGIGVFDFGRVLDLRSVPVGRVNINGTLFELPDPLKGKKKNCMVVVHEGNKYVDKSEIISWPTPEKKATALAFLHTCFVREPQYVSRKLGKYVVEFENGDSSSVDLIEGYNITDVRSSVGIRSNDWSFSRSPDVLIGSELAWRGQSANGIPLNLQKLIWKNPFPKLKIKCISIQCSDLNEYFRLVLLGVTILDGNTQAIYPSS
jgi:hypothetical protein